MLGLENVGPYMQAKQAQKLSDWTVIELDNEGKLVQEEMTRKFQVRVLNLLRGVFSLIRINVASAVAWYQDDAGCFHGST